MGDFFIFIGVHDNNGLKLTFVHDGLLIDMLS